MEETIQLTRREFDALSELGPDGPLHFIRGTRWKFWDNYTTDPPGVPIRWFLGEQKSTPTRDYNDVTEIHVVD